MRPDLSATYGWMEMLNMKSLKNNYPFLHGALREAAIWRHAALVYGTMGINKQAHHEMYEHMKVVDKVYGKVSR
jgi:hypothetical protein